MTSCELSPPPSPPPPPLANELADINDLSRLRMAQTKLALNVLHYYFKRTTADRPDGMDLFDFYADKGVSRARVKDRFFHSQVEYISRNPSGNTFDISLLYMCLRKGAHGLAPEWDRIWDEITDCKKPLEYLISEVKHNRNINTFSTEQLSNGEALETTKCVRDDLISILRQVGKLINIPAEEIDEEIAKLDISMRRFLFEMLPLDIEKYMENLTYPKNFGPPENWQESVNRCDESACNEPISTNIFDHKGNGNFESLFTDILLKSGLPEDDGENIPLADILLDKHRNVTDAVILVEGAANVGKTFLMRKIVHDWKHKKSEIKHLSSYDLILEFNFMNLKIKSLDDLLRLLMPQFAKNVEGNDLRKLSVDMTLCMKIMVILDGFEKINSASEELFDQIMTLKKNWGFTVVVTSQSSGVAFFKAKMKSSLVKVKPLQLYGIPAWKRKEYVLKCFVELGKRYEPRRTPELLLKYLHEASRYVDSIWRVPYNLSMMTYMWVFVPRDNLHRICSVTQFYKEVLELFKDELFKVLKDDPTLEFTDDKQRRDAIDPFFLSLGREALLTIMNGGIAFSRESFERLALHCRALGLPLQETLSCFLRKLVSDTERKYIHDNQEFVEFLAAYMIWTNIVVNTSGTNLFKLVKIYNDLLPARSAEITQEILKACSASDDPKSFRVESILENVYGSPDYCIRDPRLKNVLKALVGLLFKMEEMVDWKIKISALSLLQKTGLMDHEEWVSVLNLVNCSAYASAFIALQPNILDGSVRIRDHNMFAYKELFLTKVPSAREARKIHLDLDIHGTTIEIEEFFTLISKLPIRLKRILVTDMNIKSYKTWIEGLTISKKAAQEVNIDVDINKLTSDSIYIEFYSLLKAKHFMIRSLNYRERFLVIIDDNLHRYESFFESLPTLHKGAVKGNLTVTVWSKKTNICSLLRNIARNCFDVDVFHFCSFHYPNCDSEYEEAINQVFRRCQVKSYKGVITPKMVIPKLKEVFLSVADTPSYQNLLKYFHANPNLDYLDVCLKPYIRPDILKPLPWPKKGFMNLFIPDVSTEVVAQNAATMIHNLRPVEGEKNYSGVYFPRCKLTLSGMKVLLKHMKGIQTTHLVFPVDSKPSCPKELEKLEALAKKNVDILHGRIVWGNSGFAVMADWDRYQKGDSK